MQIPTGMLAYTRLTPAEKSISSRRTLTARICSGIWPAAGDVPLATMQAVNNSGHSGEVSPEGMRAQGRIVAVTSRPKYVGGSTNVTLRPALPNAQAAAPPPNDPPTAATSLSKITGSAGRPNATLTTCLLCSSSPPRWKMLANRPSRGTQTARRGATGPPPRQTCVLSPHLWRHSPSLRREKASRTTAIEAPSPPPVSQDEQRNLSKSYSTPC